MKRRSNLACARARPPLLFAPFPLLSSSFHPPGPSQAHTLSFSPILLSILTFDPFPSLLATGQAIPQFDLL